MSLKLFKVLSRNDTGETHSHQSGISIPKPVASSGIFPELTTETLNPRTDVTFYDEEGVAWTFQYIYYNDVFFGKPREKGHNEFRLTCVREYIKKYDIKAGNEIWFSIDDNGVRHIGYVSEKQEAQLLIDDKRVIKLSPGWRCIEL